MSWNLHDLVFVIELESDSAPLTERLIDWATELVPWLTYGNNKMND